MRIDRPSIPKGLRPTVFFNGDKQDRVFEADSLEGWIVIGLRGSARGLEDKIALLEPPGDGEWERDGIVVTRRFGDVRLEFTLTDLNDREVVLVEKRGS